MSSGTWISGKVVRGNGFGKKLGFPTANIELDSSQVRPQEGIYACWVRIEEKTMKGALHIGPRPAIGDVVATIEVHILDFRNRNLYGEQLSLQLVERLRDVKNFASLEELRAAIAKDCLNARRILS